MSALQQILDNHSYFISFRCCSIICVGMILRLLDIVINVANYFTIAMQHNHYIIQIMNLVGLQYIVKWSWLCRHTSVMLGVICSFLYNDRKGQLLAVKLLCWCTMICNATQQFKVITWVQLIWNWVLFWWLPNEQRIWSINITYTQAWWKDRFNRVIREKGPQMSVKQIKNETPGYIKSDTIRS